MTNAQEVGLILLVLSGAGLSLIGWVVFWSWLLKDGVLSFTVSVIGWIPLLGAALYLFGG